jgi:hypothetical protein
MNSSGASSGSSGSDSSGSDSSSGESSSDSFTNILTLGSEGTIKNTTLTIGTSSDSFTGTFTTDPSGTIVGTEVTIDPGSGSGSGSGNESVAIGKFGEQFIEGGMEGVPPAGWQVESSTTQEVPK